MPRDFAPPFCPSRMLMGPNDRAIDRMLFPIDAPISITLLLQSLQDALPDPGLLPSIKAARHRPVGTISLRQISPGSACSQDPQDPIENASMVFGWAPNFRFLRGKQGAQLLPLLICQFSSSHTSDYRQTLRFCRHALFLLLALQLC
jgi:hypothetical protein